MSGMFRHSRTVNGRTNAMQTQITLGMSERDARLPTATYVRTMSGLPYDLRREERQSAAGNDELDANTAGAARLSEHQYYTNHLRVSVREKEPIVKVYKLTV